MSNRRAPAKADAPKPTISGRIKDRNQAITDKIVGLMEAGTVPWRKPWVGSGLPVSLDGRSYTGLNALLLSVSGHTSRYWGTFKAVQNHGGRVRKGEHGSVIWGWFELKKREEDATVKAGPNKSDGKEDRTILWPKAIVLFNADQCDGLTLPEETAASLLPEFSPIERAEFVLANMPNAPVIREVAGSGASYSPKLDSITLPPRDTFHSAAEFYSTLFHEIGHSTGHQSRLGRPGVDSFDHFGSQKYGREELVAELTASFLRAETGIEIEAVDENSAAYLRSWIGTLKADTTLVYDASKAASRAVAWVLGQQAVSVDAPAQAA